jgi:hypothetical protein
MTFLDMVPSREFAGFEKTSFEPSRMKFRCSERFGSSRQPVMNIFGAKKCAFLM